MTDENPRVQAQIEFGSTTLSKSVALEVRGAEDDSLQTVLNAWDERMKNLMEAHEEPHGSDGGVNLIDHGTLELHSIHFADEEDLRDVPNLITFANDEYDEVVDGAAIYELNWTYENGVQKQVFKTQNFTEGEKTTLGSRFLVWGWDGDRENPTLNPSYGWGDWRVENGWAVHLFLKDGKVEACGDMVLEVEP